MAVKIVIIHIGKAQTRFATDVLQRAILSPGKWIAAPSLVIQRALRYFPLFSMVFPSEIAIRVENGGFSRKQNCCKPLQVYVHLICELY
jgi:hypothetical protein